MTNFPVAALALTSNSSSVVSEAYSSRYHESILSATSIHDLLLTVTVLLLAHPTHHRSVLFLFLRNRT